jgi:MarR family transcriptional regulator, organic hydroperoxide resistance regulator
VSSAAAPPATKPELVEDFLSASDAFAQAVRRSRGAPATARPDALTLSQYALLRPLGERPESRVRDLATAAGITPPTATRILDALERRGLVTRSPSSSDRRAVVVCLTAEGRELLEAQRAWVRDRQRAFFEALPPSERAVAPNLLRELAALIDELAAGPA